MWSRVLILCVVMATGCHVTKMDGSVSDERKTICDKDGPVVATKPASSHIELAKKLNLDTKVTALGKSVGKADVNAEIHREIVKLKETEPAVDVLAMHLYLLAESYCNNGLSLAVYQELSEDAHRRFGDSVGKNGDDLATTTLRLTLWFREPGMKRVEFDVKGLDNVQNLPVPDSSFYDRTIHTADCHGGNLKYMVRIYSDGQYMPLVEFAGGGVKFTPFPAEKTHSGGSRAFVEVPSGNCRYGLDLHLMMN